MKPYAPLGILYLSSHLRAKGSTSRFTIPRSARGGTVRHSARRAAGRDRHLRESDDARQCNRDCGGGAGGRLARDCGRTRAGQLCREYLDAGADVVVPGEAEIALEQLMATAFEAAAWPALDGIDFSRRGRLHRAQRAGASDCRIWMRSRGRIASASISRAISKTWRDHHGKSSISMITARGCPYKCNWCSHSVYGHYASPPLAGCGRERSGVDSGPLQSGHAVDGGRCVHDPPRLGSGIRGGTEAARNSHSFRVHHARRPAERAHCGNAAGTGLLARVDRLGKRIAAHSGCHAARRYGGAGAARSRSLQGARNRDRHVSDVGI